MTYQRITNGKYCERCCFGKKDGNGYLCCGTDGDVDVCAYGDKSKFIKNITLTYSREKDVEE